MEDGGGRDAEGHERGLVDDEGVGEEAEDEEGVQEVMKPRHHVGDQK